MIEISHIHKVFNGVTVLNDVSAVFESGKTNLIIGISGSGKNGTDEVYCRVVATRQRSGFVQQGVFP